MATTTITPTSATADTPKLLKKATAGGDSNRTPTTPTQTSFGCQHIKGLLNQARDKATGNYARLVQVIREESNVSERLHKSGEKATSTGETTYLCLQCPNVSKTRERHRKEHPFSVESDNGFIFCHDCKDFVYDPTFEELRSGTNAKKRKHSALHQDGDAKRLIAANSTATPCAATGLRGLYNMGQTCFMSVILQSLIHNPLIRTYYLSEGHRKEDCEREACTSCALDDIFIDFFSQEKHEGYGAVHILQGCWKGGGGLAGYSQQDAHEYLGFILNSLHIAITAAEGDDGNNPEDTQKAREPCTCIIHQTFGGLLKSTVTCSHCHNTTSTHDPFMDLSLDIRSPTITKKKQKLALINGMKTTTEILPMDLIECLDRFTSVETLSAEAGSYHCTECESAREAKKRLGLARLPPVVPIHLKRFKHERGVKESSSKVGTSIRFPLNLDLTPYTTSSSSRSKTEEDGKKPPNGTVKPGTASTPLEPIYELSSVVVHKGKIDNGHYISYSRQGEEWFRFDDSMVVQVGEREVLGAEAYMLFYVVRELEG